MCLYLISIPVTKLKLGMRARSKFNLVTWPPSSAPRLTGFTTKSCTNPWGQQKSLKAKQEFMCKNEPYDTGCKAMIMHHCKNYSWLDASWGCLPRPFAKRHTEISQAVNERQGDGCWCCPKCLGILQWECVPREEVSPSWPVSICHWTGVAMGGRRAASGQAAAARGWAGRRTQGDSFLWLQREMNNRRESHFCSPAQTSINPKEVQCQRGKAFSPPSCRCQHRVRLDASFQNLVLSFKNVPFTHSPSCLPCCHFSPWSLPSEAALKWNLRGCLRFVLILVAQTQKQVSPIRIPGMQLVPLADTETSVSVRHWKWKSQSQLRACVPALLNPHHPPD